MTTFKRTFRRSMGLFLSCLMLLSSLIVELGVLAPRVHAQELGSIPGLTFYVPETIYLKASDNKTFQYFIDRAQSVNGALSTSAASTGRIYFNCPGATEVTGLTVSGATASLSATTSSSSTLSSTINSGSLSSAIGHNSVTTITWTITFKYNGKPMTAKAYSAAYAPNRNVTANGATGYDDRGDTPFASSLIYIQGANTTAVASVTYQDGSSDHRTLYQNISGNKVFDPLVNGITAPSNNNPHDYGSTSSTFTGATASYSTCHCVRNDTYNGGGNWVIHLDCNRTPAEIMADTSRYTNTNQIPNLKLGYYVTDWADTDQRRSWYVSDATSLVSGADDPSSATLNYTGTYGKKTTTVDILSHSRWKEDDFCKGLFQNNYGILLSGYNNTTNTDGDDTSGCGSKYLSPIDYALNNGSSILYFRGAACGSHTSHWTTGASWAMSSVFVILKITAVNKNDLRTLVNDCVGKYYDSSCFSNTTWDAYSNALETAARVLGNPCATAADISTAVTNLTTARNSLQTKVTLNLGATDAVPNGVKIGGSYPYGYITIGGNATVDAEPSGTPTRDYYEFKGWSLTENPATNADASATVTVGYNNTLYAVWKVKNYTITYSDANYDSTTNPTNYNVETADFTLSNPTRTGYTFRGWSGTGLSGDSNKTVTITTGSHGNRTYTANWDKNDYTVEYLKGAASATGSTASQSAKYDTPFNIAANGFEYEGHSFTGWKGQNNTTYQPGQQVSNLTSVADGTFTMTAQWSVNKYNVVYDNMLDMQAWQAVLAENPGVNCDITATTDTGFTAQSTAGTDGYTNWSPAMPVTAGVDYKVITNMTGSGYQVVAEWLNSAQNHIDYSTADTQTSTFTVHENAAFMRIRFNVTANNTITCSNVRVVKVDENALLNRSNVTVSCSGKLFNYGSDYTTDLPSVSRTGYEFAGWCTDYEAETAVASGATVPAQTLHLWSKWSQIEYTINYNLDGGTNHADNPAKYTVEDEVVLEQPTKPGHTFTGWTGSNGNTAQLSVTIPKGSTGTKSYTANWSVNEYTITFDCDNGTTPESHQVRYQNQVNNLKPANPIKDATAEFTYTFSGWLSSTTGTLFRPNESLPTATEDVTYTAQYTTTTNRYTVTWLNADGNPLETDSNVLYGSDPEYNGATPTKDPDSQYQYEWSGWELNGVPYGENDTLPKVTGNMTFTATYSTEDREYTITWFDDDGETVLDRQTRVHGTGVIYRGQLPTKAGDDQYSYTFEAFMDGNVPRALNDTITVDSDKTLIAQYSRSVNTYTVTWVGANGTLETDTGVPYGTQPSFDLYGGADPTKEADDAATYEFIGWKSSITGETILNVQLLNTVTGNVTFTAQFEPHTRQYNIYWRNYNGDSLGASLVDYGTRPVYGGATPFRTPGNTTEFVFAGWRSSGGSDFLNGTELPSVTGEETYTAYYTEEVRLYTVRWIDEDGNELEVDSGVYHYNDHPVFNETNPIPPKQANEAFTYTFGGWRDIISGQSYSTVSLGAARVTQDTTYQVWYKAEKVKYDVTWSFKDDTGAVTSDVTRVGYGDSPTHTDPARYVKNEDGRDYYYQFNGWESGGTTYSPTDTLPGVTGEITYTATYIKADHVHEYDDGEIEIAPTCETSGTKRRTCIYCNVNYVETVPAQGHSWNEGEIKTAPSCISAGEMKYTCLREGCGATRTETIPKDSSAHKWIEDTELSTPATCEYTGTVYSYCEHNPNHTKRDVINALGHAYTETIVNPTCVAQGYTEYVCSRCGRTYRDSYTDAPGHNWDSNGDGTVNTADADPIRQPDCINSGILRYTCVTCGATRDELVPTLETHTYDETVTREATCTLTEKTTFECSVCHKTYSQDTHAALGHDYDTNGDGVEDENDYVTVPATCTERGSVSKTCMRCHKTVRVENLPALRHDWGVGEVTQPATCAADGVRTYTCSRCHITRTEAIPRTPDSHVYDGGVVTTPPTYSRTGLMTYTCTVCGHSYTEEIGRLERDDDDDPNHGGAGDAGNSGGNSTHHNSEGRCSMCDKYEAIQSSNSPGITKLFYSIVHFIVHLFATFSF